MSARKFQINPGPLRVVDTSSRTPGQGRGVHPNAVAIPRLTRRQADVLWIVQDHGPVTPREVGQHLLLDTEQARSTLSTLERRRLIDATYTNLRAGYRGRGYVTTARGRDVSGAYGEPVEGECQKDAPDV